MSDAPVVRNTLIKDLSLSEEDNQIPDPALSGCGGVVTPFKTAYLWSASGLQAVDQSLINSFRDLDEPEKEED